MEHSFDKYIDRQSTETLLLLYQAYLRQSDHPAQGEILECIRQTLLRRSREDFPLPPRSAEKS